MSQRKRHKRYVDPEVVRELLIYNADTGIFTWRERGRSWFSSEPQWKRWNARHAEKPAGSASSYGKCLQIFLLGSGYKAHRLAWMWMEGEQPPLEIDHIDGNPLNNAWQNLRDGSSGVNQKNKKMYRRNTSGTCGVTWHKRDQRWYVRAGQSGKRVHIAAFDSLEEAEDAVEEYRAQHGYTDRHGESVHD